MKNKFSILGVFLLIILLALLLRNCRNVNSELGQPIEKKTLQTSIDSLNEKQNLATAKKDSANAVLDTLPIHLKRQRAAAILRQRKKAAADN